MDRLKGFFTLVLITAGFFGALRLVHVSVPLVFPQTRQGPIDVASLDEVRPLVGFAPVVPAYRPALLGERPTSMTVSFHPRPTFAIVWRAGEHYLSVTHQQGGSMPAHPPIAQPLTGIPNSTWWTDGVRSHAIVARDGFWIVIDTSLPPRDLARLIDTLTMY